MARSTGVVPVAAGLLAIVLVAGCGSTATPSPSPSVAPSAPASAEPSPSASAEPSASPAAATKVYVVKKGDTLIGIAKANGVTLAALRAANPTVTDPKKLRIGQKLLIPQP